MEGAEEDFEQDYFDTMEENAYLSGILQQTGSPRAFFNRDKKIFARSVAVNLTEQDVFFEYNLDIDGCVVELNSLEGVNMPVRHLTVCPKGLASMCELKSFLKKHLDLCKFSKAELSNFNHCVGFQLFYEQGWECYIGRIPRCRKGSVAFTKDIIRQQSYQYFEMFKRKLREKLLSYVEQNIATRTLMKNDLSNLGRMFILPDDTRAILTAVQEVLNRHSETDFEFILFCFRFGEKTTNGLCLRDFNHTYIERVTAHAAVNISSDAGIDLLWSMSGLQDVVGDRGVLRTCLSFTDCGTFQSNLDGRAIDIKPKLRQVCQNVGELRFVQLYADIPHIRPKTRFHPISGCIAGGRCFAKATSAAYHGDALRYLSILENNWRLMRKGICRLELVICLKTIPGVIRAEECINIDKLGDLLQETALIVPFPQETFSCIRRLGMWIVKELMLLFHSYKDTGNIGVIWQAYQLELASEKLLWGQPLCFKSNLLSINLGPGTLAPSRCLSDYLGFLALEPFTACMGTEESIPPFALWTASEIIGKRIVRFAGMHDFLESSLCVIGRRLLSTLLHDLFEVGKVATFFRYESFLSELKASETRLKTVGAITVEELVRILSVKRRVLYPMVYGILCDMLEKANIPMVDVLRSGFGELKLQQFPAIETVDQHKNAVLKWSLKCNFWKIVGSISKSEDESRSASELTELVRAELGRRRLIYVSNLKKAPMLFPWIRVCMRKLANAKLEEKEVITTLTFVSCVAFLMEGWFVDFDNLKNLASGLPITQHKLRDFEILSKLHMSNFNKFPLFRLHASVPHKMVLNETVAKCTPKCDDTADVNEVSIVEDKGNKISVDDNVGELQDIDRRTKSCLPVVVRTYQRWSAQELEILHDLSVNQKNKSIRELYIEYQEKCMENNIPFRTDRAFVNRYNRL